MKSIQSPKVGATLVVMALLAISCGSNTECRSFNVAKNESVGRNVEHDNVCNGTLVDAEVLQPDGMGPGGAPVVPCEGKEGALVDTKVYECGLCGGDVSYPVICSHNRLACPTSYITSQGSVMSVDPNYYVVNMQESFSMSGQCAFLKTYSLPGFRLQGQASLQTNHDVGAPVLLRAVSSWHGRSPSFDSFFVDRALGEKAIFALVTLVDLTDGTPVEYLIGQPQKDPKWIEETLALTPVAPLAPNHAYRLTINPGEQQSFVPCHTYGSGQTWLTAPESVDFFTYSRPMLGSVMIAYKSGTSGYFAFNFTEPLSDLDAYPSATVTVDGIPYSGCMLPYACSGSLATQPTELRLDSTILPTTFSTIVLRIPHAVKSINGGTILDGTRDNPHATIDGDIAVYTFDVAECNNPERKSILR